MEEEKNIIWEKEVVETSKRWDAADADIYEQIFELSTLQASIILYNLVRVKQAKRICEVGCGTGIGPRTLLSSLIKPGTAVFWSDSSQSMIDVCDKNIKAYGLDEMKNVKYEKLDFSDQIIDASQVISDDPSLRQFFLHKANSEQLPYSDEFFDRYIANLVIMHVTDHKKAISEAYRVLQKDGIAGFTVIGRQAHFYYWQPIREALTNIGVTPSPIQKKIEYLSDMEVLKAELEEVGFKNIKMFYRMNYVPVSVQECFKMSCEMCMYRETVSKLSEDQMKPLEEEFTKAFNRLFEAEPSLENQDRIFPSLEMLVAIAQK